MSSGAARALSGITTAYDFSQFERIVDVGGGYGALLDGILSANPRLRGVLVDLPEVALEGLLVALIAEQGAVLGLARMWEAFVEGIGWETKIFPTLAEAETWVRDRVKAKFKLDIAQFTAKK